MNYKLKRKGRENSRQREEILAAAEMVFARKGFFTTKIQDIAKMAGYGIGTIYKHFKNKESILIILIRNKFNELINFTQSRVNNNKGAEKKLKSLIYAHLEFFDNNRDLFRIFAIEHASFERNLKLRMWKNMQENFKSYEELFKRIYTDGVKAEIFRDEDITSLCLALVGMLNYTMFYKFNSAANDKLIDSADALCKLFINGVRRRG
ncbi:MAG TPA: TetR/AcrR family transcriptional regulator [bacterium]